MGMIFFGRWYASSQRLMAAEVDVLTGGDPFSEPTPQRRFGRARQAMMSMATIRPSVTVISNAERTVPPGAYTAPALPSI